MTISEDATNPAGADARASRGDDAGIVVDLSGVTFTYEGETAAVLRDISLTVTRGEFVLVLGPSGCGKSTLLHLLNGSVPHILNGRLRGDAVICGKAVADTKVAAFATEVGMVFQDPDAQIINTRVGDEVRFGLENLCRKVDEILIRQKEALDDVGLPGFADCSIFELSGGQKQRVSIAAALAARPQLLVLDEPTANLDPVGMADVFTVLARLNRDHGTTIVMVEHRVDELADKVSRVIMMDNGAITFDGPPRTAFSTRRMIEPDTANGVATASWIPQVAELALDLAAATHQELVPAQVPLCVAEAVDLCLAWPTSRLPDRAAENGRGGPAFVASDNAGPESHRREKAMRETLLSIRSLNFGYDVGTPILKNISLKIESGAIIALLGQNGSGKTTLARLLVGINAAPAGTISFKDKDLAKLGAREIASHIGYVFQNPDHQFVTDQVDEEIGYGLKVRNYPSDEIARRVDEVLAIVDLKRYRRRSPFSLSLGERRRLSVATMLVLEPQVLVLDEPTIGQDYERAQQLMGLMARLRDRYGTAVLMITHDVRLVAQWAERAVVLRTGEIAFDGAPIDLFAKADVLRAAGLLAPPIHDVSRKLAARTPRRGVCPVLSTHELISALQATDGERAT
jgi:energy-coupling factor transport system ATP-binding protein